MELRGKKAVVVGLGRSGLAAARLLLHHGASVRVLERDVAARERADVRQLETDGAEMLLGAHARGQLGHAGLVILSPGVPPDVEPVREAREAGLPVLGEMELGARLARGRLVGITGSNGKSTTTSLAARMLAAAGLRVNAGGNLGRPLCDFLLEGDTPETVHCLEVSSFQCETLEQAHFVVACLLNVSPDHLDRYPSLADYTEAKLHLFDQQRAGDVAVMPADDPASSLVAERVRGRAAWFGRGVLPGAGVTLEGDVVVSSMPGAEGALFERRDLWTVAPHHLDNAMAAAVVALAAGGTREAVAAGLRGFAGLPHRGEVVASIEGVTFVNDSKATNVDAAVRSIGACGPGSVVILGGRHKGGDLSPLRAALSGAQARAVLVGEAAPVLREVLAGAAPLTEARDLDEAVETAAGQALRGGTVLLAPACASFDMFRNYEHRGDAFVAAVRARVAAERRA